MLALIVKNKNGFSANLQVTCQVCYLKNDALRKAIGREKRKRDTMDRSCMKNRKKVRRMTSKIAKLNKKRSGLMDKMDTMKLMDRPAQLRTKNLGSWMLKSM